MSRLTFVPTLLASALLAGSVLAAQPAAATPRPYSTIGTPPPPAPVATAIPVRSGAPTTPIRTQVIDLAKGRSAVIDLPADAGDVFVSNPNVADAVLRTPRRIFVMGVTAGVSDALFFDASGRQILNLSIRVDAPTDELSDTVHRLFPGAHVDVQSLNGQVILSGMAATDGQADQILRLAQTFADKPEHVLNLMTIAGKDQVTLKVRIVEIARTSIKQLGFSNSFTIGQAGGVQYTLSQAATFGVNNTLLGGATTGYKYDSTTEPELQVPCATGVSGTCYQIIKNASQAANYDTATAQNVIGHTGLNKALSNLEAFERVGLARTLAEPDLTAVSGESAKFLAGGEFPVPVSEDSLGHVTVEFKPFGVGLGFTPVVQSSGRISLKVSTEVSELTNTGAFTNGTLTIPALDVRRAETSVEMQSGSSLMIAGLLKTEYKQTVDSLPGLTTLPVIGTLLRSRDYQNDETEMVVIVTPYIVSPTDPNNLQTPADNLQTAGDLTTVFMGRVNKVIAAKTGAPAAVATSSQPYQAPVGYVIE